MREPQFVPDLSSRLNSPPRSDPVLPPLPKRFPKKRTPDFFRKGITRSFIFHLALVLAYPVFTVIDRVTGWQSEREAREKALREVKTAIRVDVVDLPSLKLSEMEKIDLTKEVDES